MQKFMEKILHEEKNGKPSSSSASKGRCILVDAWVASQLTDFNEKALE